MIETLSPTHIPLSRVGPTDPYPDPNPKSSLEQAPPPLPVVAIICSTWTDGVPPPKAKRTFDALSAPSWTATSLARVRYAVFGLGNSLYGDNFCKAARDLDQRLLALGAQRVCLRAELDDDNYR